MVINNYNILRFKFFKDNRMSVDDGQRSGCPSTITDDAHITKLMRSCVLIDVLTV